MKEIDFSTEQKDQPAGLLGQLPEALRMNWHGSQDAPAQEIVVASLKKALNNSYVLLRQVSFEGLEDPIPLVLIGPPGIYVLNISGLRGVYRSKGEGWEELRDRRYRPLHPNLITGTHQMGRTVEDFLKSHSQSFSSVEKILVFTDPGTHVESQRPAVRIVLADALERFPFGLMQSQIRLNQEEIQRTVDLLARSQAKAGEGALPIEIDDFNFMDEDEALQKKKATAQVLSAREQAMLSRLNKVPFSGRQWVLLASIIVVNIIIVVAFLLLVLTTA